MDNSNEAKKIYVITSGEYSDYAICALTSDYERAKVLAKYYTKYGNEAQIEEYIDGDPASGDLKNLKPVWTVRADIQKSGPEWRAWIHHYTQEPFKTKAELYTHTMSGRKSFDAKVMAETEEKALKIAQDLYAKLRAEELGL